MRGVTADTRIQAPLTSLGVYLRFFLFSKKKKTDTRKKKTPMAELHDAASILVAIRRTFVG
jgi:hypothetical protein